MQLNVFFLFFQINSFGLTTYRFISTFLFLLYSTQQVYRAWEYKANIFRVNKNPVHQCNGAKIAENSQLPPGTVILRTVLVACTFNCSSFLHNFCFFGWMKLRLHRTEVIHKRMFARNSKKIDILRRSVPMHMKKKIGLSFHSLISHPSEFGRKS